MFFLNYRCYPQIMPALQFWRHPHRSRIFYTRCDNPRFRSPGVQRWTEIFLLLLWSPARNTVRIYHGKSRISLRNYIQLLLHLPYLSTAGPFSQIISRPGRRDSCNLHCRVDIDALPIIIPQNLNGGISLLSQRLGTPLGHPVLGRIPAARHSTG